jgi:glycosyltransferase involved in cell wall biosynthesis
VKILIVTDAWLPQVNSVVTTLAELVRHLQGVGHSVTVVHAGQFRTWPCPGHEGIELALFPGQRLCQLMDDARPDAIHIATEGPLGWAARRYCQRRRLAFTTAFHTKFPEILQAALKLPLSWGYALVRWFHRPSSGVMVPTLGVMEMLRQRGFRQLREWTHGVDTRLFALEREPIVYEPLGRLARPVSLYVGRVSHEKNIQAFLELDLPGSKVVCGVGPLSRTLRERYPGAHWLGVLPRKELAHVYAAADVFVFPCPSETFGLEMLEAMACGTPVAAYPVDGPLQVLGSSKGGALNEDLGEAWADALKVSRSEARARAEAFDWGEAGRRFVAHLVPVREQGERRRPAARPLGFGVVGQGVSHKRHSAVE